jgi:hypothetical protein
MPFLVWIILVKLALKMGLKGKVLLSLCSEFLAQLDILSARGSLFLVFLAVRTERCCLELYAARTGFSGVERRSCMCHA